MYMDEAVFGVEYELLEDVTLSAKYQYRTLGRVLEDVSTDGAETYVLANPGEWSGSEESRLEDQIDDLTTQLMNDPMNAEIDRQLKAAENKLEQFRGIRLFDKPQRDYHAFELVEKHEWVKDSSSKRHTRIHELEGISPDCSRRTTGSWIQTSPPSLT